MLAAMKKESAYDFLARITAETISSLEERVWLLEERQDKDMKDIHTRIDNVIASDIETHAHRIKKLEEKTVSYAQDGDPSI